MKVGLIPKAFDTIYNWQLSLSGRKSWSIWQWSEWRQKLQWFLRAFGNVDLLEKWYLVNMKVNPWAFYNGIDEGDSGVISRVFDTIS